MNKNIAIWLDYSKAHIIRDAPQNNSIQTLDSGSGGRDRFYGETSDTTRFGQYASTNEDRKANKERELLNKYYQEIQEILLPYDHILLLGSGNAKSELRNILVDHKQFTEKIIVVKDAEAMSENQLKAFVKNFFGA